ncbi:hypothetical protein GCM10023205_64060 [Yinghuangia aomiensis]|uniref:Multifunctional fusion protein n=1 Tax=Yinghuangia aomiensis TaxID=676205 RepID=A0ABP9I279_9ACTN
MTSVIPPDTRTLDAPSDPTAPTALAASSALDERGPAASGAELWAVCPACRFPVHRGRRAANLDVCPECGDHARLGAPERIRQLMDPDAYTLLDFPVRHADPLGFTDSLPYPERLRRARRETGLDEAVLCAQGTIGGHPVVVAAMDFRFMGGSLGGAVGELIALTAERALRDRTPLLIVTASGGARMQEGAIALMQMAKTAEALGRLDEAGILTLSLVTDPTFGGVAASFATLADVIVVESGARLGFAGPRVIAQTIRQTLPEGFQTAEFLLANGMVDLVRRRGELRTVLARLLAAGSPRRAAAHRPGEPSAADATDPRIREPERLTPRDPWHTVRAARDLGRPTTLDHLGRLVEDFEELRGDRLTGDCPAIVGGPALFEGRPVMVVGHQKGHTLAELADRNYGMANPAGYRKAARLMRLAAKLRMPVLTFVDTPGAYPGVAAEERGQSVAIAENLRLMAGLPVPVVTVVTGEGGSGGALALAVADRVMILEDAVYSVISPEGCAAILWQDPAAARTAAEALRLDAANLLRHGIVDAVVPVPPGGAQADHAEVARNLRGALAAALRELAAVDPAGLPESRRERFRRFGRPDAGRDANARAVPVRATVLGGVS